MNTMTHEQRRSGAVLGALLAFVGLATPSAQTLPQIQRKSLDVHIEEVTGRQLVVNCGEYEIGGTPRTEATLLASLACARDAATQHKPFRIVVHSMSEDSRTASGVLSKEDSNGHVVFWFLYDSAPCGGPYCAEQFETTPWSLSDIAVFIQAQGRYQLGRLKR
jgi:hypothetical protein